MRVLIVDDHEGVAEALALAFRLEKGILPVGTASDIAEALLLVEAEHPDVVLMDVSLDREDGIVGCTRVLEIDPNVRVIVYTARSDAEIMGLAREAGAVAFLSKRAPLWRLANAIRMVGAGNTYDKGMFVVVVGGYDRAPSPEAPLLSPRQLEVLMLMRGGFDARAIAGRLDISLNTARSHVKAILTKLGAHSQLEAVARAVRLGLLG